MAMEDRNIAVGNRNVVKILVTRRRRLALSRHAREAELPDGGHLHEVLVPKDNAISLHGL